MEISSTSSCRDSLPRRWCTLLGEVRVLCSLLDSERRGKGPDFFDIHFDVRKSKDTSWNLHGKMLYILDILGSTLFSCWKNMGIWSSLGAGFIPIYHGPMVSDQAGAGAQCHWGELLPAWACCPPGRPEAPRLPGTWWYHWDCYHHKMLG